MAMFNVNAFTDDFEDFELPDRNAKKYTEIEDFEDFELSNNVAYELASRNEDVQNELNKFIAYRKERNKAIIEFRQSAANEKFQFRYFDYKNFFEYGFDEIAIQYLLFRTEADIHQETREFGLNELCGYCDFSIDLLGMNFENHSHKILYEQYMVLKSYLENNFVQGISCRYIKKDNEIVNIHLFDGSYYDANSDNPYNLTESSKDNYIFKKGLYTYKDDPFNREPLPLWHESYDEILPTVSLNYKRPVMRNPYINKHIYAHLNFNLEEDEILSNVKRIIEINNSQSDTSLKQKILDASDLFFEKYKPYKKPEKIKKNKLQNYYANMLYVYDTFKLFDKYLIKVDEKYNEGMEAIKSQSNKDETDGIDRDNQKNELKVWRKEKQTIKILDDQIYNVLFDDKEFAPDGSHEVNNLKGLAKRLIDEKQYRFLI